MILTYTYEELKEAIKNKIPKKFWDGIVNCKVYTHSCPTWMYNFDPYKNHGKPLPDEIRIINKGNGREFLFTKEGLRWFIESLALLNVYDLQDYLPVLFIYGFCSEFIAGIKPSKNYSRIKYMRLKEHMVKSGQIEYVKLIEPLKDSAFAELNSINFMVPHSTTKYYIPMSQRGYDSFRKLIRKSDESDKILSTSDMFADTIVDIVNSINDNYIYEYWTYPKEEYIRRKEYLNKKFDMFMAKAHEMYGNK